MELALQQEKDAGSAITLHAELITAKSDFASISSQLLTMPEGASK